MPGNDIQGGFATHIVVPGRGLCEVDVPRLARVGLTLADVSIVADALTTPYQAVRRAGVTAGSLAIVVGAGGVGGYCAQIANALGAKVVAIDVDDDKLASISRHGAALTLNSRTLDGKAIKSAISGFAKQHGLRRHRVAHLRMLRHRGRPAHGVRPAGAWRDIVGGRLHDGQDRDPPLQPDGLRRARDRQLGLPARVLPGRAGPRARRQGSRSAPFVEAHRSTTSTEVFAAVHHHEIKKRAVLVPSLTEDTPMNAPDLHAAVARIQES